MLSVSQIIIADNNPNFNVFPFFFSVTTADIPAQDAELYEREVLSHKQQAQQFPGRFNVQKEEQGAGIGLRAPLEVHDARIPQFPLCEL